MYNTGRSLPKPHEQRADTLGRPNRTADQGSTKGRLLVVEEHQLLAAGLQLALSQRQWHVETNNAASVADVVDHAQRFAPDCVVVDTHLFNGVGSGIALIAPLVAIGARVVMLTAERRRTVLAECLETGAVGWIRVTTPLDEVDVKLGRVVCGGSIIGRTERSQLLEHLRLERERTFRTQATFEQLTNREALVLAALVNGLTAEEIAREHFVAVTTVRSQIHSMLQKLGVRSQLAAVALAHAHQEMLPYDSSTSHDRRRATPVARECGPTVRSA